jgi:hypothetical protein
LWPGLFFKFSHIPIFREYSHYCTVILFWG